MGNEVKNMIRALDKGISNYGFSTNRYGMMSPEPNMVQVQSPIPNPQNTPTMENVYLTPTPGMVPVENILVPGINVSKPVMNTPSYTINPEIQKATANCSTFMLTISVARTGTGSGNTYDPVFLFGTDAYNGAHAPYNVVQNSSQTVATGTANGKNVLKFTYGGGGNTTTYTVSLSSRGDYPFILQSLAGGKKSMQVQGIQIQISNVDYVSQLTRTMQTFFLDDFGYSNTNDLLTPKDLYQQSDDGVYIPHQFEVSGRRGLLLNVNNVDGFEVSYYFYIKN